MIQDRPAHLLKKPEYRARLPKSISLDFSTMPEPVRAVTLSLFGIQPVTGAMGSAAGGKMQAQPSPGEVALFRERGTTFQMVNLIASLVRRRDVDGVAVGAPFALTLLPASKRGKVDTASIDFIEMLDVSNLDSRSQCYRGFDPFSGSWSLYGDYSLIGSGGESYFDELGLVLETYFLATDVDRDDILFMGDPKQPNFSRFNRKLRKHFFEPFVEVQPRRVWGVESPIELFLLQELTDRGHSPICQMLIMRDGSVFPSLYDRYFEGGDGASEILTEVDLFFEDLRVAVFCDGRHHNRPPQAMRDRRIDTTLAKLGIKPVRVQGAEIMSDLSTVADRVEAALCGA